MGPLATWAAVVSSTDGLRPLTSANSTLYRATGLARVPSATPACVCRASDPRHDGEALAHAAAQDRAPTFVRRHVLPHHQLLEFSGELDGHPAKLKRRRPAGWFR